MVKDFRIWNPFDFVECRNVFGIPVMVIVGIRKRV
jgi:hypothetical protein